MRIIFISTVVKIKRNNNLGKCLEYSMFKQHGFFPMLKFIDV